MQIKLLQGKRSRSTTRNRNHLYNNFRSSFLGALSLSAASSSSATAANFTTQAHRASFDSASGGASSVTSSVGSNSGKKSTTAYERKSSLDSVQEQIIDCTTATNNKGYNRWNISGASQKAAFVSPPSVNSPKKSTTNTITPIRVATASSSSDSMKRAPSPPVAFTSSIKRLSSFGVSSATTTTSLSMSSTAKDTEPTNTKQQPMTHPPLYNFRNSFSHSWLQQLSPEDPENYERSISQYKNNGRGGHPGRPVFNGHYVSVRPTALKNPKLVIHSPELLRELGFHEEEAQSAPFVKYFSGNVDGAFEGMEKSDIVDVDDAGMVQEKEVETWATPYALSIMGRRYTNNCPYGTGDGYGDGRAISVGEILVPKKESNNGEDGEQKESYPKSASRYELQLKGAGQTPFCRGADGRAVLRSSIREFLASEAMHNLGISTTRALSLIVSDSPGGSTSTRPWYSDNSKANKLPSMDDPRLAQYDDKQKKEILSQLAAQAKSDPDMLVEEKCAITTRVASSFVRIGHLDLFARRVEMLQMKEDQPKDVKETMRYQELEDMMWHACYREYYDEAYGPYYEEKDAKAAAMALMEGAMNRIADMVGGWIRVGFVQGNFNADNCLVGGRTMDYGPFGFLDVYHPLSAKWTGSGEHFGFMNQPNAGYANFGVLVESLLPIIDANGGDVDEVRGEMLKKAKSVFSDSVDVAMRSKMGLDGGSMQMSIEADELWGEIEPLLRIARGDWTLFWRQLTYVANEYSPAKSDSSDYDGMVTKLLGDSDTNPFYDTLTDENRASLRYWIEKWHKGLTTCYKSCEKSKDFSPPEERMRLANPKYTLREWMLVDAYSKADPGKSPGNPFSVTGDYSGVHELFELCKDPYAEGTDEMHKKYYRRASDESLRAGGTAFMS